MISTLLLLALSGPPEPVEIDLWPEGTPGAPTPRPENEIDGEPGERRARAVHRPRITVYRPEEPNGAAVVVCPGGGYAHLSLDKEGHEVARWLADQGIVGAVLEYRLPRPAGHVYGHGAPLADAERALALVRENAAAWAVRPDRVGILGFSAGGHLAATASVHLAEGRPDFTVLVYPVISFTDAIGHSGSRRNLIGDPAPLDLRLRYTVEAHVSESTPPAFLVHTEDDFVKVEHSLLYWTALREHGVPTELHVFERGGHGYGMRRPDLPVGQWPELLLAWMGDRKLLGE